jgi:D-alanyl-lipoteichoic acid acyltransferase DltB (MBOAT superfamily)
VTFNSYTFILVFLPIAVAGFYALSRLFRSQGPALAWLVVASLVFYTTFGVGFLAILLASVLVNFAVAATISRQLVGSRGRTVLLVTGVVLNLLLLGGYKYTGFVADNINAVFGTHLSAPVTAYPVGLSFYTFIQIGFLIDTFVMSTQRLPFLRYALFGTFFPYITAGPITRRAEMLDQLDTPVRERTGVAQVTVGATMFAMGLFKKAVLADSIAPFAAAAFDTAATGGPLGAGNAWLGAVAYTLQLYFDFSGYTDMALGIAYMLGIKLPVNFNSPLRATSMVDFWRRWHMTMTRFFTNYIYTPFTMRLMRRAVRRSYAEPARIAVVLCLPIVVTFLLVGLWHGAGWGFVVWGAIQGVALAANLVWRELQVKLSLPKVPSPVGWALTMLTFVVSVVYFRAPTVGAGNHMLQTMLGAGPAGAPAMAKLFGTASLFGLTTYLPVLLWTTILVAVALLFPSNTQQLLDRYDVGLPTLPSPHQRTWARLRWQPSLQWAFAIALLAAVALTYAGGPSPFLYYKF